MHSNFTCYLLLWTDSFSFYMDSDKPDYEKLSIIGRGVSIRTAIQSIKRRKNPEKWRGEAFEDSN